MGQDVERTEFTRQDRQRYREKVRRCLDVFARMLSESKFDFDRPLTGLEIEFNLIDGVQDPAMRNSDVLHAIENPDFQTELGQFNIEINVPPRGLGWRVVGRTRNRAAGRPQRGRAAVARRRRAHRHDRNPADADARAPEHGFAQRQPALRAVERADLRRAG